MVCFDNLNQVADLFKVLGDENRLRILCLLMEKEQNVTELSSQLDISQPATSSHLRILKNHYVVKNRKEGREVFYSLDDEHIYEILHQARVHLSHIYR
ncbi:MAG TPA: winged helix-turn-helix transcriptional regulator [Tissierellia bacterium]|jgi:DNA-binding transcriptional ArsR family regulator|nr:winged helix-turn-helix transcriptional regulator [Tissierellia bacterium]